MDFPVVWSPEAIEDLDSIAEYIGRDSDFYARAVVTKVLNVTRAIPDFPMMGRRVPELDDENIRERLVYSYRVVYKVQAGRILIVAVIHGKREIENVSARFSPAP
jgi:plasmid stabilization system protein ParE